MKTYWAAEAEDVIGGNIIDKFKSFRRYMVDSGQVAKMRKSYRAYYGNSEIQDLSQSLKAIHVNNYASLCRNLHVMVTSQRPAWQPRAINSDLDSQSATELGASLLDYYMREKNLEEKFNRATEFGIFLLEGWMVWDWDVNAGDPLAIDEESGNTVFSGDVSVGVHHTLDVARDIFKKSSANHKWWIIKEYKNRYDLAATYPDLAENILSAAGDDKEDLESDLNKIELQQDKFTESDLVPIFKLYHDKTPALPEGRLTVVIDKDTVLFDGPLPYKRPYVFQISGTDRADTSFGHSYMHDLLALQDVLNMTFSAIVTNQAANAVQNFQKPKGDGFKATMIADGMRVLEFDPKLGPIQPLDLLRTSPEVYKFADMVNQYMQLISNISSISRGEAPASMSGAAMALLQQQSIQFNNGLQLSHVQLLENGGTALLELLQQFAVEPRNAVIVGKTKAPMLKSFSGKDLKGVSRVIVDSANPLTKTGAGRVEIANQLLQRPDFIKTPEQYLGVLTTGNLEPLYEFDRSRQYLTKSENEMLLSGKPVQAVLTDDHAVHVLEHSSVVNNLEARKNPSILQAALAHIQEHMNIAQQMSPQMAAMGKQTSFAAPPAPPPPQGTPGQVNPEMLSQQPPLAQEAGAVQPAKPAQSPLPPLQ